MHEARLRFVLAQAGGDEHATARLLSTGGFGAGAWLSVSLRDNRMRLTPEEFEACACLRIGADQPVVTEGMRCATCGAEVDSRGTHFFHCPGATLGERHDGMRDVVGVMARECTGAVVHHELLGVFQGNNSQKRAD